MKIAALIARILLGLVFFVFGLNGFLHFLPVPPLPDNDAGHYIAVMVHSHYIVFVSAIQVIGGALMLIGRYVPLALILLGPVIVNILLYHSLMEPKGIVPGLVAAILWFVVAYSRRENLAGIFAQ
jgi:putative oxidoreductase